MKTFPFILAAVSWALIGVVASAQTPLPPLPSGPLVQKRAPNFAKWDVTIVIAPDKGNSASGSTAATNADDKGKVVFEVTMTKTGKTMLREVHMPDGKIVPTWCLGDLQITIAAGVAIVQAKLHINDPSVPTPNYEDYSDSDFQGFDWIKASNYTGIKEVGGRKCLVFQDTLKEGGGPPINRTAHVDLETRLPVDVSVGGATRNYSFKTPPTAELVFPPPVAQLLKNLQREMDSAAPRWQVH